MRTSFSDPGAIPSASPGPATGTPRTSISAKPALPRGLPVLPPALLRTHRSGALPVRVIVKTAGDRHHEWDASLDEFAELVRETGNDEPLTLVFGPFASRHPAQPHAFTANGLAG